MSENKEQLLIAILGVVLFGLISAVSLLVMVNFEKPNVASGDSWLKSFDIRRSDWLNVK